jgi:signal peptidase I
MNPYLIQNDLLFWEPITTKNIEIGDVVIFMEENDHRLIIHRVIEKRLNNYFITKGDNNRAPDTNPIHIDRMVGFITGGVRGNDPIRISMGKRGMFFHHIAQLRIIILPLMQKIFSQVYYFISDTHIFSLLLSPFIEQKLIVIKTPEGHDLQLYYGKHLAGWKAERDRDWTIRIPFRLFIDTSILSDSILDISDLECI